MQIMWRRRDKEKSHDGRKALVKGFLPSLLMFAGKGDAE